MLVAASPSSAQAGGFSDVADGRFFSEPVDSLASSGVLTACDDDGGRFCPDDPIDRKTMAVWMVRVLDGSDPAPGGTSRDGRFDNSEYVDGPWLDQQPVSGWQSLGIHDLNGRVRIEVRDTRTRDDYRDVGNENARLAVDAIRLRSIDGHQT